MAIRRCAECGKTLEAGVTLTPKLRPTWVRLVREPDSAQTEPVHIRGPEDVHRFFHERASRELVEVFYVLTLNSQSRVVSCQEVTRGILNASLVHPREVFRLAIAEGAAGIVVVHNHPSGDPTPSADDRSIRKQLVDAGKIIDIPVYVSFAEAGLL
jgi:DNA repair protein RadC